MRFKTLWVAYGMCISKEKDLLNAW